MELVKRDAFRWIFGSVTPFGKTLPPSFCSMFKPILVYTGLIKNTFNTIRDEDCAAFTVCVGTTILECEDFYLGMRFFNVNHDVFNGTSGNNYLGAFCSFIHDSYLNIVALKLMLNNKTHGSEYNA